jgi:predicted PurR-regulated permease PerM
MKLEKRKQFIVNFLYFAIILGVVILLTRYALGVLMPFIVALLVSLLLKPFVAFFNVTPLIPRSRSVQVGFSHSRKAQLRIEYPNLA